jgi:hypothetical protein
MRIKVTEIEWDQNYDELVLTLENGEELRIPQLLVLSEETIEIIER